jgi:NADH-quinone oxidoreductase subunit J
VAAIGWLVVHFVATAGAYLLLESEFLAAVQVLVYAGAILVLFLFVVMLLSLDRLPDPGLAGGAGRKFLVLALVVALLAVFGRVLAAPGSLTPFAPGEAPAGENTVEWLADALFTRHLLAFELASVPLLAAMAGVLVYTTRRVKGRRGAAAGAARAQEVAR